MKRIRSRFLSVLLTVVMAFGMAATALAAETDNSENDAVTIETQTVSSEESDSSSDAQTEIDSETVWKYHDTEDDPAGDSTSEDYDRLSWTYADYDDSSWSEASGSFGAKYGAIANLGNNCTPDNLLTQYKENGDDIEAYFFRTTVTVEDASAVTQIAGSVTYDDSATIYINGTRIAGFYDDDATGTTNMEYYGSGNGSPVTSEISVTDADTIADALVDGENTVAVEVHNQRASSSDIYFELTSLTFSTEALEEDAADEAQTGIALNVGEDETERNITWYYDADGTGTLTLAKESDLADGAMPSSAAVYTAEGTSSNKDGYYYYQVEMTDLEEDTTYAYQLTNGDTVSEIYTFETGADDGSFTFALAGDPQIGTSNTTTDTEGWCATLDIVSENSIFSDIAFLLSVGDQVDAAADEDQYDGFLSHSSLTSLALATAIGNHDTASAAYSQHFNNSNVSSYGSTTAGSDYYYVYEGVLFMVLNSNNTSTAEHKAFMEEAIAATADQDISWKVVSFHHSIYSVASHSTESAIIQRREELVPVFEELDIDVVLMGHDHVYARTWIMDGLEVSEDEDYQYAEDAEDGDAPISVTDTEGILYVTANSASGSKYYSIKTSENFEYAAVMNQDYIPNISLVTVTENSFTVTTYETSSMTQVDTFSILRTEEESSGDGSDDSDTGNGNAGDDSSTDDGTTEDGGTVGDGDSTTEDDGAVEDGNTEDGTTENDGTVEDDSTADADTDDTADEADDASDDTENDADDDTTSDADETTTDNTESVETGDSVHIMLYLFLLAACAGAAVVVSIRRRRTIE